MIVSRKDLYLISLIIYLICLPLNAMNIGTFGSALKVIALLPLFFSFYGMSIRYNDLLKVQGVFTLFAALSLVWTFSFDVSIGRVISYVELLALLFTGSNFEYTEFEIKKVKMALAWSSRLTAIVMLRYAVYVNGRLRLMGAIKEDPNYLCAYFAFGVIFALQKVVDKKENWNKITGLLELIFYFYLILVSGSRGGLIAIVAGIAAYMLVSFGKQDIKKSIGIVAICVFILIAFTKLIDYLPPTLQARFTIADVTRDGGSGRGEIWANGWNLYSNASVFRWLFGFGTATTKSLFAYYNYSQVNVMHNMFLETLVELGAMGLVFYCFAIGKFVKRASEFRDKFSFAVIVCMVVMSLSTSIYTFKPYFNIMLFIVMSCYLIRNDILEYR